MTQNTEQNVRTREELRDAQCIEHIARLMREKMKFSREVKGRSGWQDIPADVLSEMLREHVEKGDPVDVANFCMMLAAKRAPISDARGAAEQRRKDAEGYLFDNPDTGTEYLPHHPIESGECQYAANIRKATNSELLSELNAAWTGWKEDRDEKGRISANVAALEARAAKLEKALLEIVETGEADCSYDIGPYLAIARAALTREGGV